MKTRTFKPEPVSHTIQHKTKASSQASISKILQAYKDRASIVQRETLEEDDELLQGKFEITQREAFTEEEEEPLQGKFDVAQCEAIENKEEPLQQKIENKTGLPDNLKAGVESMSGYSMDNVRVHYNSSKPAELEALAYTQGTDIYVGPGQEKHLPHEAWHVVQQKQGRVQPTVQMQGLQVNDDEGLEREADEKGRVVSNANSKKNGCLTQDNKTHNVLIQRIVYNESPKGGSPPKLLVPIGWKDINYQNFESKKISNLIDPVSKEFKSLYVTETRENVDIADRISRGWNINKKTKVEELTIPDPDTDIKQRAIEMLDDKFVIHDKDGESKRVILHPYNYTDLDVESDVDKIWNDDNLESLIKTSCVLISMIYERSLNAYDKSESKQNIENLIKQYLPDGDFTISQDSIGGENLLPINKRNRREWKSDNIIPLIKKMHDILHVDESMKRYDLSHINEIILKKEYNLLASPNCVFSELSNNIQNSLKKDKSYIFHVSSKNRDIGAKDGEMKGHATTVKIKKDFRKGDSINKSEIQIFNYDKNSDMTIEDETFIESIWEKK